jgi:uncharacterized protein
MSISLMVLAWIGLAVLIGAFIQGTTGMGFALIVAPVIGILEPRLLPGCLLILMLPLNAYIAWRERAAIDFNGTKWITAGRVAGTFGGLWVLIAIPLAYLNALIGGTTILAALVSLLVPPFSPGKKAFVSTGFFTGITETATGIGGPPLALVYQHMPVATVRSSIALCFLIGEMISLIVLAFNGRIVMAHLTQAVELIPVLAIGIFASHVIHQKINSQFLRSAVLVFAIVSGIFILVHG